MESYRLKLYFILLPLEGYSQELSIWNAFLGFIPWLRTSLQQSTDFTYCSTLIIDLHWWLNTCFVFHILFLNNLIFFHNLVGNQAFAMGISTVPGWIATEVIVSKGHRIHVLLGWNISQELQRYWWFSIIFEQLMEQSPKYYHDQEFHAHVTKL